ncbi:hypothetical protein HOU00_gp117 [Caulobacter phage CcrPW]|uniref:Uncharacterized protein n=1 Tax=Caulobacter phage CcrPW TaxID=2283271 RepID=A0A385ECX9_9CAUD|nr:hypothetical protein HOU00_gp020 [Caulobacter phage CcrPW]YP_009809638.1 hypothetical protein HOU00_gp117 [Caulobacter phage CcrPW]AXQ68559.1 hypothetical protein CcrPW_gp020 [Caulobacter phage CcrPW]AXQ69008.1 hypothetical protein CcrPW_gp469 [Caulobacter phage CcrPW]
MLNPILRERREPVDIVLDALKGRMGEADASEACDSVFLALQNEGYAVAPFTIEGRRLTQTDTGVKLGDALRTLFEAVPNYAVRSQRLADAVSVASGYVYQPRYRFLADDGTGAAILTNCDDGRSVYFQPGPDADEARAEFERSQYTDETAEGFGVAGLWRAKAAAYFNDDPEGL